MTFRLPGSVTLGAAAVTLAATIVWSGNPAPAELLASAHAIIGRPLTPVSYAGVARRTTYRAAAVAPVAGPVVVAPVVAAPAAHYPPECVRIVDAATGAVAYRCP